VANPQKENGHIDIANEIVEQLAKIQLSGYESRMLWVIWRKTYGWHKKKDVISISQFQKFTGLDRRHVQRTLNRLIERNIITKNGYRHFTKWAFQKDYTKWKSVARIGTSVAILGTGVAILGTKPIAKNGAHKRNYTKETNTKEMILSQINKLKSQFPEDIKPLVMEYIELIKAENKTGRITASRQKRTLEKLYDIYCKQTKPNEFKVALEITVDNEAPHPNYIKKVLKTRREKVDTRREKDNLRKKVEKQRTKEEFKKLDEYEKLAATNEEGKKRLKKITSQLSEKMGIGKNISPP